MLALPNVICLWPGLPRLWIRGDWTALAIALAFGLAVNLLLVSTFVWTELLPPSYQAVGWMVVGIGWCGSACQGYRSLPDLREPPRLDDRGLFIRAQAEYLKGHWYEAETALRKLLRQCRRDADALLMLAAVYRHTRRYDEAARQLERLDRLDGSVKWRWEIEQERTLLKRLAGAANNGLVEGTAAGRDAS